jgi:hypothetical protein
VPRRVDRRARNCLGLRELLTLSRHRRARSAQKGGQKGEKLPGLKRVANALSTQKGEKLPGLERDRSFHYRSIDFYPSTNPIFTIVEYPLGFLSSVGAKLPDYVGAKLPDYVGAHDLCILSLGCRVQGLAPMCSWLLISDPELTDL